MPSLLLVHRQHKAASYNREQRIFDFLRQSSAFDPIAVIYPKPEFLLQGSYPPPLLLKHLLLFKRRHRTCFDICWTPEVGIAALARELRFLRIATEFVYDESDVIPALYSRLMSRVCHLLEIKAVRNVDLVTTLCEELKDLRVSQGASPEKIMLVPNGVDYALFSSAFESRSRKLGSGSFRLRRIAYVGQLSFLRSLSPVLNEVVRRRSDVILMVAGQGELPREYYAPSLVHNVRYLGMVRHVDVPKILSEADIGLAFLPPQHRWGVPLKMLEYAAAGLPIATLDCRPMARFVNEKKVGVASRWEIGEMADAIMTLLDLSREEYLDMSRRATMYAQQYDWKVLLKKYERIIVQSSMP